MTDNSRKPQPKISRLVREHLMAIEAYAPIEPPEVVAREIGIPEDQIVKLDANENLYGPSPKVKAALSSFDGYHYYPDPEQREVRQAVARYAGVEPEQVILGNGSDEMLDLCARLFLSPGDTLVNFPPSFGVYSFLGHIYDANTVHVERREDFTLDIERAERELRKARLAFVATPNNPTGNSLSHEELERLLAPGAVIAVDEAYAEFAGESFAGLVKEQDNLVVLRTFSKWAGLAGMRAGYAIVTEALAEVIWRVKIPYNLSVAAEQAILASLDDVPTLQRNVDLIRSERDRMHGKLAALPWLRPFPSSANFILCEVRGITAGEVRAALRQRGILIRYFDTPGLRNCIRVSVGLPEHTDRLIEALTEIGAAARA
jgi:histidinol-phosphate aminotransferase